MSPPGWILLLALAGPPTDPLGSLQSSPGNGAPTCAEAWKKKDALQQQPSNCEASLVITEEVTRLLTRAAAHCTRSHACIDGPGARIAVNDIRVCPSSSGGGAYAVEVSYCFTRHPEGDTRGCGRFPGDCGWMKPTASVHTAELRFRKEGDHLLLRVPDTIPGMGSCTKLTAKHAGACYGDSPAFEPKPVPVP